MSYWKSLRRRYIEALHILTRPLAPNPLKMCRSRRKGVVAFYQSSHREREDAILLLVWWEILWCTVNCLKVIEIIICKFNLVSFALLFLIVENLREIIRHSHILVRSNAFGSWLILFSALIEVMVCHPFFPAGSWLMSSISANIYFLWFQSLGAYLSYFLPIISYTDL